MAHAGRPPPPPSQKGEGGGGTWRGTWESSSQLPTPLKMSPSIDLLQSTTLSVPSVSFYFGFKEDKNTVNWGGIDEYRRLLLFYRHPPLAGSTGLGFAVDSECMNASPSAPHSEAKMKTLVSSLRREPESSPSLAQACLIPSPACLILS